jgi:MraZ protein
LPVSGLIIPFPNEYSCLFLGFSLDPWWGKVSDYVKSSQVVGNRVDKDSTILAGAIGGIGMFVGEFSHSLDPKKRLTIPAVWRAQVGTPESLFVLPDFHEKCLNVFPAAEMALKLEKMRRHSMADRKAMEFARTLGASSDLVSWDSQGRIRIKDKLLNFAGITDQVQMVGAMDKFQLWSPELRVESPEVDQAKLVEAGLYVGF